MKKNSFKNKILLIFIGVIPWSVVLPDLPHVTEFLNNILINSPAFIEEAKVFLQSKDYEHVSLKT